MRDPSKHAANDLHLSFLPNFASIFAALGDETRLRLIAVLCAGSAMSIAQQWDHALMNLKHAVER